MSNLNKIRINNKIKKYPKTWEVNFLMNCEFPEHIWINKTKKDGQEIHYINYYIDPLFDKPFNFDRPCYQMPYEDNFDTKAGLLHQLAHMFGKKWFTAKMASEVMHATQTIHRAKTGKDMFWWNYGKDKKIYE